MRLVLWKYRAWDKKCLSMHQVSSIDFSSGIIEAHGLKFFDVKFKMQQGEYILMQFARMQDDARNDIYEGDIFKPISQSLEYVVSFDWGGFALTNGLGYWGSLQRYKECCEKLSLPFIVTGNIWQKQAKE